MEFSRQELWSGLPFPSLGDLPDPGMESGSPVLQAGSLPSEPPGKPCMATCPLLADKEGHNEQSPDRAWPGLQVFKRCTTSDAPTRPLFLPPAESLASALVFENPWLWGRQPNCRSRKAWVSGADEARYVGWVVGPFLTSN